MKKWQEQALKITEGQELAPIFRVEKNNLKKYGISLTQLGEMFGYKNQASFLASARKKQVVEGAELLIDIVEQRLKPLTPSKE